MLTVGPYSITTPNFGNFRLDGGAMFGSVPKNLWAKKIPADQENCIPLATRSLLLKGGGRTILVDVGCGTKWGQKETDIFRFEHTPFSHLGFSPDEVTDIILTHLHFDHAGGISYLKNDGLLAPTFPNAKIYLQSANLKNAKSPNLKERASYLAQNISIVESSPLTLIEGDQEILPGIFSHRVDGHTVGQQWIEVRGDRGDGTVSHIYFPTDLIPTAHHLPLPFQMGYDMCVTTSMVDKERFLESAIEKKALVVFQHDVTTSSGLILKDEKGQYRLTQG